MTIRTDVPPQLNPLSLNNIAPVLNVEGSVGEQAYASAVEVLQLAHDSFARINDTEMALKKTGAIRMVNGRPEAVANHLEFGKAAHAEFGRAQPKLASTVKGLTGIVTVLETRVNAAISDPTANTRAGVAMGTEIRNFVRALGVSERTEFIHNCVQSGDKQTLHALLSHPAYLSGMDAGSLDNLRNTAAMHFAKQDFVQLNGVKAAIERVNTAQQLLMARIASADAVSKSAKPTADEVVRRLAAGQ
jgi:hypothetical protein